MIHTTCPCCEVACPPHRDGCTFYVDCQSEAKDFDDVALLRAEVARLRQERRWIPVGERLPDEKVDVLARGVRRGDYGYTADETVVTLAWRSKDGWSEVRSPQHSGGFRCTEWMPLPEKEEVGRG